MIRDTLMSSRTPRSSRRRVSFGLTLGESAKRAHALKAAKAIEEKRALFDRLSPIPSWWDPTSPETWILDQQEVRA